MPNSNEDYDPIHDPESISVHPIEGIKEIAGWAKEKVVALLGKAVDWVDPE